jgi:MYXO-CTERM domain-containing protein
MPIQEFAAGGGVRLRAAGAMPPMPASAPPPVKIEAQFTVGEYDIVVLSATDSTALDAWLRQNRYKIPAGAEPYLRPYVQMGMKFFVAKVDVSKVKFERLGNGPEQAMLSPLRFHYDSDAFGLPIRLGLINSSGTQDLVVTILAPSQRYEVANYDNVAVPTTVDVSDATRNQFASFYAQLFDETVGRHPRSVVTEYSWSASSCDPCPTPPLEQSDLMTLGADVLPSTAASPPPGGGAALLRPRYRPPSGNFVITRLHARYSRDALGDDLVFRAAPPIVGGREFVKDGGNLEQGARPDSSNNFQARYVIRHPWTGPIACKNPSRGVWGGPPGRDPWSSGSPDVKAASKIGLLPRAGVLTLASFVRGAMPPESFLSSGGSSPLVIAPLVAKAAADSLEGGLVQVDAAPAAVQEQDAAPAPPLPPSAPNQGGCAGCATTPANAPAAGALLGLGAVAVARLRRRRN